LVAAGRLTVEEGHELLAALEVSSEEETPDDVIFTRAVPGAPFPPQMVVHPMPPVPPGAIPFNAPIPPVPPLPHVARDVLFFRRAKGKAMRVPAPGGPGAMAAPPHVARIAPFASSTPPGLVVLTRSEGSEIMVRVPLGQAVALDRLLPRQAREHLSSCGVELGRVLDAVGDGSAWIGGAEHPLVHVQQGGVEVRVTVE
jgi:hypothetical protein